MAQAMVNVRELRNHGGDVIDRVVAGEVLTLTRGGKPVAEIRPLRQPSIRAEVLLRRWRNLPPVDGERLRADIDGLIDQSL